MIKAPTSAIVKLLIIVSTKMWFLVIFTKNNYTYVQLVNGIQNGSIKFFAA